MSGRGTRGGAKHRVQDAAAPAAAAKAPAPAARKQARQKRSQPDTEQQQDAKPAKRAKASKEQQQQPAAAAAGKEVKKKQKWQPAAAAEGQEAPSKAQQKSSRTTAGEKKAKKQKKASAAAGKENKQGASTAAGGAKKKKQKTASASAGGGKKKQMKLKQGQQAPEKSVHEQFMEEVAAREHALAKHCIILGQFDGDEDEASLEQLQALTKVFVPEQVQEDFIEVWSELDDVGNDSEDEGDGEEEDGSDGLAAFMKAFMGKFLSTQHSAQMHAILGSHLKAVDKAIKAKDWQQAFCRWAATLMAARRESHWWEDTDVPGAAAAIHNKLRLQWAKLRARSDEELGGLVCEGQASAKEELGCYLNGMAEEMRGMDYDVQDV